MPGIIEDVRPGTSERFRKMSWITTLASGVIVIGALYLAKSLLVPLTLAVLLSFLLMPVCDWLERRSLSRIPAVLTTAVLGFTLLGIVGWIGIVQVTQLAPKIPQYQDNIQSKLSSMNEYAAAALNRISKHTQDGGQNPLLTERPAEPLGTSELPFSVRIIAAPSSPLQVFGGMFGTVVQGLGTIGIVIVLVMFFLIRREDLRDRFIHLVGKGQVSITIQMLEDAGARVSRYLSMLFLINATFGASVGIGLFLIGVPNALLWGILGAALRFVPYIGPWIAAAMPIGLSMAISTGWIAPMLTVALFIALELFSNNVLEPWLYGKNTGVSPVAILVAAVFWLWLWGPVGLLLATPLTVCLLVVGRHFPQLSFLGILLGSEPVFSPRKRVYQRLLAGDQEEADELLEDLLKKTSLAKVYDTTVIPALALTETHWQRGEISDGKHKFIIESLMEMVQDRVDREQEAQAKKCIEAMDEAGGVPGLVTLTSAKPCILCLPARSDADGIASMMVAHVLGTKSCDVNVVSVRSQANEILDLVEQRNADLVFVSATPPNAIMHARYLCKQLRHRFPELKLIVGIWDAQRDLERARERIGCGATVVATFSDANERIRQLLQDFSRAGNNQSNVENVRLGTRPHPSHYPASINVRAAIGVVG